MTPTSTESLVTIHTVSLKTSSQRLCFSISQVKNSDFDTVSCQFEPFKAELIQHIKTTIVEHRGNRKCTLTEYKLRSV